LIDVLPAEKRVRVHLELFGQLLFRRFNHFSGSKLRPVFSEIILLEVKISVFPHPSNKFIIERQVGPEYDINCLSKNFPFPDKGTIAAILRDVTITLVLCPSSVYGLCDELCGNPYIQLKKKAIFFSRVMMLAIVIRHAAVEE
jgi:hypothetical protein